MINTAKVEAGAKCIVFGLGGIGLNVIQGLRIVGVDVNPEKKAWGERFGMTHFVNAAEVGGDLVPHLVNMTKSGADQIGGADYTFECVGNVNLMRAALESCHRGWGQSIIIGVAGAGQEISTRPFQFVTDARRPRADVGQTIVAHGALSFLDSPTVKTSHTAFWFRRIGRIPD